MHQAELSYKQNKQSFPKAGTSEYQALQQQAAAYLVTEAEYEQDAARRGITITDKDVDTAIGKLVKERFGGDRKKLDDYLKTTGYSTDDLRTLEYRQVLRDRLAAAVTKGISVTPTQVKSYYDSHKSQTPYTTPAQRKVRHILVALNAKGVGISEKGVTDTTVDFAKSKALADKLYQQLKGGAKFDTLVKKYSQDPGSRSSGGVYVDVKGAGTAKEFETVAFALKTNEVSKPTKTQFGYHIIQAIEPVKTGTTQSFAQASKDIRKTLLDQKKNDALSAWAKQLGERYKGKVKYASGYAPPTTTSTTTSP
jgi:parvulin-like peptidyl-prolyl isomerase